MKITAIQSGKFTEAGNFSAYNAAGQRIHVPGRLMEALGLAAIEDIKFPLFALAEEREFAASDKEGETETFKRVQATSVFLNQADAVNAKNADAKLEIEAAADLNATAKASGLTAEMLTKLETAAPF
jgi:hypothetical protein